MGKYLAVWSAVAVLGVFALFAAACGDAEGMDFSDQIPEDAPHMDQRSLQFHPRSLTVNAGDTVYFSNSETALHFVAVDGEDVTGDMRRGDVVAYTFETPGEYDIACPYHPQMRATITVE